MADTRALRETLARMHPDKAAMFRAQPDDLDGWSEGALTQLANAAERRVNQGTFDSMIGPGGLAKARAVRDRVTAVNRQTARARQAKQEIAQQEAVPSTLKERWLALDPRQAVAEDRRLGAEEESTFSGVGNFFRSRFSKLADAFNPASELNAPKPSIRNNEAFLRDASQWGEKQQYPNPLRDNLDRPFDPIDFGIPTSQKDQSRVGDDDPDEIGEWADRELRDWTNEGPPAADDRGLRAWGAPPTRGFSVRPRAAPPNNFQTPATQALDIDLTRDFVGEASPTFADRTTYGMPARTSIYGPGFERAFAEAESQAGMRGLRPARPPRGPEVAFSDPRLSTLSPEFDGTARRQRAMVNLAGALSGAPSLADLGKEFADAGAAVGVASPGAYSEGPGSLVGRGMTFADRMTGEMPASRPSPLSNPRAMMQRDGYLDANRDESFANDALAQYSKQPSIDAMIAGGENAAAMRGLRPATDTVARRSAIAKALSAPGISISDIGPQFASAMGQRGYQVGTGDVSTQSSLMGPFGVTGDPLGYGDGTMASAGSDDQSVGLLGPAAPARSAPSLSGALGLPERNPVTQTGFGQFAHELESGTKRQGRGWKSRKAAALAAIIAAPDPMEMDMAPLAEAVNFATDKYVNARDKKGKLRFSPAAAATRAASKVAIANQNPGLARALGLGGGLPEGMMRLGGPLGLGGRMGPSGPGAGGPGDSRVGMGGGGAFGSRSLGPSQGGPGAGGPGDSRVGMGGPTGRVGPSGPSYGGASPMGPEGHAARAADAARAERERAASSLNSGYAGMGYGGYGPGGMFGV